MSAHLVPAAEIPVCLLKRETDADFGWFSHRRLLISKGDTLLSLSADDLKRLVVFFEANKIEEQL